MCHFAYNVTETTFFDSDGHFGLHKQNQNRCHQTRFLSSKYIKNAFVAGAPPRTPLGELTALPQTP